ncbi:MAG TPA: PilZ domain-containing protein [Nitrospirae bacterium]|nr:PilZ domain-containing protein [Nitrospirota bacterium]
MVNERSSRIPFDLEIELVIDGIRYDGTIENISSTGIQVKTVPLKSPVNFSQDKEVEAEFRTPADELFSLTCKIIWSETDPSDSNLVNIGLEISEYSPDYDEFYKIVFGHKIGLL